ncbi:MAG: hypothetical protein ACSHX0_06505 [Akkermansiaceae bacterium]
MDYSDENRAAFNQKMNAWASRQGVWAQLTNSGGGQSLLYRLFKFASFLALLLVIAVIGFGVYLIKRPESEDFKLKTKLALEKALSGQECKLKSITVDENVLTLNSLSIEGTNKSFYHSLEARFIDLKMMPYDGFLGNWNAGTIKLRSLDVNLRAGADNDGQALDAYESLFIENEKFDFDRIEVAHANLEWGYSELNMGSIKSSEMTAYRHKLGWTLVFTGGEFSHGVLRKLKINKVLVNLDAQGVHVTNAKLASLDGKGSLELNFDIDISNQPKVAGYVQMNSVPLETFIHQDYLDRFKGSISAEGEIRGSTNTQQGVVLDLNIKLNENDSLLLRDAVPLMSTLRITDAINNYGKLNFTKGGFQMKVVNKSTLISEIDIQSEDLVSLSGGFEIRPPSYEETAEELGIDVEVVLSSMEGVIRVFNSQAEDMEKELEKAATQVENEAVASVLYPSIIKDQATSRFEGEIKVSLKPESFVRFPRLMDSYPVDVESGEVTIDIPLDGTYETLTKEVSDNIFQLSKKITR